MERSTLCVEGKDDLYSLVELLIRHDVPYRPEPWPLELPEFKDREGCKNLLRAMPETVRVSTKRSVGFVLDADSPLVNRWNTVRRQLQSVGVDTPYEPPPEGFIGRTEEYRATVGVWLMPDNRQDGAIETFLETLIDSDDPLIGHAESATDTAKELGAKFAEKDTRKAVIHAWLAWQEEPGRPFGTAIRAKFFRHDSPAAVAFVAWFKRLYGIS